MFLPSSVDERNERIQTLLRLLENSYDNPYMRSKIIAKEILRLLELPEAFISD